MLNLLLILTAPLPSPLSYPLIPNINFTVILNLTLTLTPVPIPTCT